MNLRFSCGCVALCGRTASCGRAAACKSTATGGYTALGGAVLLFSLFLSVSASAHGDWSSSSRQSANIAPLPQEERGAVVQAYAARVWGWRGWFADHTWLAVKPENGADYTVYEVIGWRARRGLPALRVAKDVPDRYWFGGRPRLLTDVRGDKARALLPKIAAAAESYPYPDEYTAFPGPNSNTFTAWIAREVPELNLKLPWRAIGKNYLYLVTH